MRVLFRVGKSVSEGSGHFSRCLTMMKILQDYGNEIFLITNDGVTCDVSKLTYYVSEDLLYTEQDSRLTLDIYHKINADWLVLDGYNFKKNYIDSLYYSQVKIYRIDDKPDFHLNCDVYLNQNLLADEFEVSTNENCKKFLGLNYLLVKKEIRDFKNYEGIKDNVLITLGQSSLAEEKIDELVTNLPEDFKEKIRIISTIKRNDLGKIKFIKPSREIEKLIARSKFVITSGGTTMWESMCLNTPFMVYPLNETQKDYCLKLEKLGVTKVAGTTNIVECFKYFLKEDTNVKLVNCYMELVNKKNLETNILSTFQ